MNNVSFFLRLSIQLLLISKAIDDYLLPLLAADFHLAEIHMFPALIAVKDSKSIALPMQEFYLIFAVIYKDEQIAQKWILTQFVSHKSRKRINSFSHINALLV